VQILLTYPPIDDFPDLVRQSIAKQLNLDPDKLVAAAGPVGTDLQQRREMRRLIRAAGQLEPEQVERLAEEAEESARPTGSPA
jgi:hypothetical protein